MGGAKTQEIRPHVPIPNYNSYDNKMRLESTDKNTHGENTKIDSAVTISYNDNSKITTIKELEAKQIIIELDKVVHERRDRKLLHRIEEDKVDHKTINKKPTNSKIYIREKKHTTTFHTPNNTIYI